MNNDKKIDNHEYEATLGLTSEDAVNAVGNRYDLVLIGARRVRELANGHRPKVDSKRGKVLTALKEIEFGLVGRERLYTSTDLEKSKKSNKH